MARLSDECPGRKVREVLGMVRVDAHRTPDIRMGLSDCADCRKIVVAVADGEETLHARGAGAAEDVFKVLREGLAVQVYMCIEHPGAV